jgi:hypothetical protein
MVGWLDFVDARMNHHRDNRIHVVEITQTPTVAFVKSPTIDHIVAHARPCLYAGVSTPDKPKCGPICDTCVCVCMGTVVDSLLYNPRQKSGSKRKY